MKPFYSELKEGVSISQQVEQQVEQIVDSVVYGPKQNPENQILNKHSASNPSFTIGSQAHPPSLSHHRTNLGSKDHGGKKDGSSKDLKTKEKRHSIGIRKGKKEESSRLGNGRRSFHIFKQMARGKAKTEGQKVDIRTPAQSMATRKKKGGKELMASLSSLSISNELGNKESEEGLKAFGEAIGINWNSPRGREKDTAVPLDWILSTNFGKVGLE
ncbi:hypothetical protein L6452_25709 [Arctium lappa]|uniref:Uncharacterized protein n=1 Tax=Arctium lappa TaxID=4217 RepID=A0ACB9AFU8_ARCLA|nr:hypothetical protein L6452_25709 [Arctium lappa]